MNAAVVIMAGIVAVAVMVIGAAWIHRDFTRRGDDPLPTILAWILFWPLGVHWWLKERREPIRDGEAR